MCDMALGGMRGEEHPKLPSSLYLWTLATPPLNERAARDAVCRSAWMELKREESAGLELSVWRFSCAAFLGRAQS